MSRLCLRERLQNGASQSKSTRARIQSGQPDQHQNQHGRQIALAVAVAWVQGFIWSFGFCHDERMGFGGRSYPNLFQRIAALLMHIVNHDMHAVERDDPLPGPKPNHVAAMYLDDATGLAVTFQRACRLQAIVVSHMQRANLEWSDEKTQGVGQFLRVLGVFLILDWIAVAVPADKVEYLLNQLQSLRRQLPSLDQKLLISFVHGLNAVAAVIPRMRHRLARHALDQADAAFETAPKVPGHVVVQT